ncbi:polyketide cyclase [Frateuria sp. Soil773]|uniref:SRPBCC family protein n=1 Tax=Frateuria sp. Soil773 TaxID=1736407 RepID=UPI000701B8FE|nr:SRPBCC family protein [Frateuria sp. Soil773]KRE89375.1 polyketide cyclase [Frateuria sp. Soil773]
MNTLTAVLLLVAVIVLALLGYAAARPDTFRVERTIHIEAAPETVFAQIDDFRRWSAWSPYEKRDPAMKRAFDGPASGLGAVYGWSGNNKVGEGRMEIVRSAPASRIEIRLDFVRPFEAHNTAEFTLAPQAGGTEVRWAMHGPSPYLSKLMGIFIDMDKMIGKDFETGLAGLKAVAER